MAIEESVKLTPLLLAVLQSGLIDQSPCFLVDVGASGGVLRPMRAFAHCLHAIGFDPRATACRSLNQSEPSPNVRYIPYALGFDGYDTLMSTPLPGQGPTPPDWQPNNYVRSSAARVWKAQEYNSSVTYGADSMDDGENAPRISLDDYLDANPVETVDFIKIDTDGHDYEVLLGAERTLQDREVMGLLVECQFHGSVHPHANTFTNIDRFLRERGFSLFNMDLFRYSRDCLPSPFTLNIPAQTESGQILWSDALYLRDIAAPDYSAAWGIDLSAEKLLKLACLFEIFELPDCAADVLLTHREKLGTQFHVDAMLDLLTPTAPTQRLSFADYNQLFDTNLDTFYPSKPDDTE